MTKKTLIYYENNRQYAKSMDILEPEMMAKGMSRTGWKILELLSKKQMYPLEIAQKLKLNEQTVYYHVKLLQKAGMIEISKTEEKNGAICKYYATTADSFGIELPVKGSEVKFDVSRANAKIVDFFHKFASQRIFNGSIVVGSPVEHGPYLTSARDGHYAIHLGVFLGGLCNVSQRFIVKLDTEVKAENAFDRNLVVVGGPLTNMISSDLNQHLKIKFHWANGWSIFSDKTKKKYSSENDALIAKIKNPWHKDKEVILLAGLKFEGTKTCIIALTQFYKELLKNHDRNKDFYCVVKGLDIDGDGKVDSVKILETLVE